MKKIKIIILLFSFLMLSCSDDDANVDEMFLGDFETYILSPVNAASLNGGTVTILENEDGSASVILDVSGIVGTSSSYEAYIYSGTVYEGGSTTVLSLNDVPAGTGNSTTIVTEMTYSELQSLEGYVEVVDVESEVNEATVVSSLVADIGNSAFTESITYELTNVIAEIDDADSIEGTVTISQRGNGDPFVEVNLQNTTAGTDHAVHIHSGSVADPGAIAIPLNNVNGATGVSRTSADELQLGGSPVSFDDLMEYTGYVTVHVSDTDLTTALVGDIGSNGLTGEEHTYAIESYAGTTISSGTVTFKERTNGSTLVEIKLKGSPVGGSHPAHIHENNFAVGGDIVIPLNNVEYTTDDSDPDVTAVSWTSIENDYDTMLSYDGYVAVHLNEGDLATIIGLSDIGANELSGEEVVYGLGSPLLDGSYSGTISIRERVNETSLITIMMNGTVSGESYPAGLYAGSSANGVTLINGDATLAVDSESLGIDLNPVNGTIGISHTSVADMYTDVTALSGFVAIMASDVDDTILATGDMGDYDKSGENTGYSLEEVGGSGVSGSLVIYEAADGNTIVEIQVSGTAGIESYPAHIHNSSDGEIAIPLNSVDPVTGVSQTYLAENYVGLLGNEYYINVHLPIVGTVVATAPIGASAD